ncbi:Probable phosphoribosylformimino-5-aminoimidazole carboxamideribotide isomerase [Moritella viscosa]|uniref:Probable phosphoribosylformimino-5-aminoimidazole carboxamideribotide isomerase n=1 Tax=Moritella viscosa TaxID=80854 RepID=A0A090IC45_9GAMM|nr:phosphoribosylformimino-5-aminoimidazole carboxamide ribotide isomerase [Moritella viscosa]CED59755.1 phosphoribosylformimino-5-aminoimidazole carboxamide ribotide isomerase [Moritella viscosa]SGY90022.1 Probable phosphoribosylformimino-5-aminoimidazole carboxamideribotide isomerase [Moritella viscosa]SGZ16598.1 Probable phosphoribosylformimino-5-aminoimidazole carboxamideribotide isomerase [Moritella viscosa]SHO02247.1 Probable phosphoribosylformimino-5-aminoimidazole carboxamideribotide is
MTQFRPCIDLHQGKVKQIVGGSLNDQGAATNFISQYDAAYYADIYRQHDLRGGHVIALGPNNETEVLKALKAWPQGLQFGGGVNLTNATKYIAAGASHVIVTSYLFDGDEFSWEKLAQLKALIGKEHLILDLSCRKTAQGWNIATNRWQTITSTIINADTLTQLSEHCAEFLIHAADVEGLQNGIDQELVTLLGQHTTIPVTYAGGARSIDDLVLVDQLSKGKVDLTIGSALDIFGGSGITLQQCIDWNQSH